MERAQTKQVTYWLHQTDPAPEVGQYLVFIGKRGILSVNLIRSVRRVVPRKPRETEGYRLDILLMPELKEYAVHEPHYFRKNGELWKSYSVWVRGEPALPTVWSRRNAK